MTPALGAAHRLLPFLLIASLIEPIMCRYDSPVQGETETPKLILYTWSQSAQWQIRPIQFCQCRVDPIQQEFSHRPSKRDSILVTLVRTAPPESSTCTTGPLPFGIEPADFKTSRTSCCLRIISVRSNGCSRGVSLSTVKRVRHVCISMKCKLENPSRHDQRMLRS